MSSHADRKCRHSALRLARDIAEEAGQRSSRYRNATPAPCKLVPFEYGPEPPNRRTLSSGRPLARSLCEMKDEILIRLSDDGLGFIYSVRCGVDLIESGVVAPDLIESTVAYLAGPRCSEAHLDEYYGGSEAMD